MSSEKYRIMLSGYIDEELSPEEKTEFEEHLKSCSECRKELEAFRKLKEVTGAMKYADIPEPVWDKYWSSLYRRTELGLGWVFFSIGAILLLSFAGYHLIQDFFLNPKTSIILKIGVGTGLLGFIILMVSVLRERVFAYQRDRYREVKK